MFKKISLLSLIVILCLAAWPRPTAQAQGGRVLFEEDFEGRSFSDDLLLSDNWELDTARRDGGQTGVLIGTAEDIEFLSVFGSEEWREYTLELDIRFEGSGVFYFNSHIDLEVEDCLTGHSWDFSLRDETLLATTTDEACERETLFDEGRILEAGQWYTLTFFASRDRFALQVDGELLFDEQTPRVPNGFFTLNLLNAIQVEIDSLRAVAGLEGLESNTRTSANRPEVITLSEHGGRYQEAVAELSDLGLIPKAGRLLFQEDYAFFTGAGNWFTPLARNSPRRNVVVAGELTFTVNSVKSEEVETCALSSRIISNNRGSAVEFLDVSLVNTGEVVVIDVGGGKVQNIYVADVGLRYDRPYHLLYIVQDETITVFIDGELVLEESPVTDRAGSFGISLVGKAAQSRCEGRNIWVYSLD
jgi:hypothetical protein